MKNHVFRDREFIRTPEDLFFCVVGDQHPNDRAVSYLRYIPSDSGGWGDNGKRFRRAMPEYTVPHLLKNIDYLKKMYSSYVFYSDVFNVEMSAVPHNQVIQHYIPQDKLRQLSELRNQDFLQEKAIEITSYLADVIGIPFESFGITGSVLIDLHNIKFSDIDFTVSGNENGFKLKRALPALFGDKSEPVNYASENIVQKLFSDRMKEHHLSLDEVKALNKRQWNYGSYKGTIFSMHPTRSETEKTVKYGDQLFHSEGLVTGKAVISDISESLFNPHIYKIKSFNIIEGSKCTDIQEIITYSGLYGSIFEEEDEVNIRGKLELVEDCVNETTHHRVVVGSTEAQGHDYIKLIHP